MLMRQMPLRTIRNTATAVLVLICLAAIIGASPPASVSLVYFRAENGPEGAHLQWQTATELDTAGFRIRRAPQSSGPFVDLQEIGLVAGQGSATNGHTYDAVDEDVVEGQTYWYRLIEIEFDNSEHELETISLRVGATPTATTEAISTPESGGTQAPPTGTSTSTPSPTTTSTLVAATASLQPTIDLPTGTPSLAPPVDGGSTGNEEARPIGGGIGEAAQPTALAQATGGYPEPIATESVPNADYPDAGEFAATPTLSTTRARPGLVDPTDASGPANPFTSDTNAGNLVGGGANDSAVEGDTAQSSGLGRILLWIGFITALLIFIAGVFFSILLSTRRQQRPDDVPG